MGKKEWFLINITYWSTNKKSYQRALLALDKTKKGEFVDNIKVHVNNEKP